MNPLFKPNLFAIVFLIVLSSFALKDLTKAGLYTSHDGETHTARIAQYYQAIIDGQIPPRYAGSFYNYFGSPIFVYIYPAPYILGFIVHLFGFTFVDSFKTVMGLGFIFSGIFSYLWLKELFKSESAAFLGALFYMYSPYRLQLIYVRGSISELVAYTFTPLALFTITLFQKTTNLKSIAFCSLSIAAVLLSQNLVAILTVPFMVLYATYLSFHIKKFLILKNTLLSVIWALAISSFTYIPAVFERSYIKFDEVFKLVYGSHFVTLKQILRSPWGYGFDLPGTVNDQMSFQIGLVHLLIITITLILVLLILVRKKLNLRLEHIRLLYLTLLATAICIFLTHENEATKLIWKNFHLLQIIDIPWRILGLIPIFVAIMAAFLIKRFRAGILLLFLIFALFYANRNHIRINKSLPYEDEDFLKYKGTATQLSEFTPNERRTTQIPDFTDTELVINTVGGWAHFWNINSNSKKISFNTTVISDEAILRVNRFYFPGVKAIAYNNGMSSIQRILTYPEGNIRLDTKKDTHGFIYIPVKKGTYRIELIFGETLLRNLSNLITLFSLSLALAIIIKNEPTA